MLETIFRGVFDTQLTNTITPEQFLLEREWKGGKRYA